MGNVVSMSIIRSESDTLWSVVIAGYALAVVCEGCFENLGVRSDDFLESGRSQSSTSDVEAQICMQHHKKLEVGDVQTSCFKRHHI